MTPKARLIRWGCIIEDIMLSLKKLDVILFGGSRQHETAKGLRGLEGRKGPPGASGVARGWATPGGRKMLEGAKWGKAIHAAG